MQARPTFNFLALQQIKDNIANLIAKLDEKEKKNFEAEIKLLDSIFGEMQAVSQNQKDLESHYPAMIKEISDKLPPLYNKFVSFDDDELSDNALSEINELEQRSRDLKASLDKLQEHKVEEDKQHLNHEQQARIATGRALQVKKQLEDMFNKRGSWLFYGSIANCALYNGIDAAIGITEEKKLDLSSKKVALWENKFFSERNMLNAQHNLKPTVTREVKHSLEASVSPMLLKPNAKWKKQAEDKNLHEKVRQSAVDELAKYKGVEGKTDKEVMEHLYHHYDFATLSTHTQLNRVLCDIKDVTRDLNKVKTANTSKESDALCDKVGRDLDYYEKNVVGKISASDVKLNHVETRETNKKQVDDVLVNGDTIRNYDSKTKPILPTKKIEEVKGNNLFRFVAKQPIQPVEPVVTVEEENTASMKI